MFVIVHWMGSALIVLVLSNSALGTLVHSSGIRSHTTRNFLRRPVAPNATDPDYRPHNFNEIHSIKTKLFHSDRKSGASLPDDTNSVRPSIDVNSGGRDQDPKTGAPGENESGAVASNDRKYSNVVNCTAGINCHNSLHGITQPTKHSLNQQREEKRRGINEMDDDSAGASGKEWQKKKNREKREEILPSIIRRHKKTVSNFIWNQRDRSVNIYEGVRMKERPAGKDLQPSLEALAAVTEDTTIAAAPPPLYQKNSNDWAQGFLRIPEEDLIDDSAALSKSKDPFLPENPRPEASGPLEGVPVRQSTPASAGSLWIQTGMPKLIDERSGPPLSYSRGMGHNNEMEEIKLLLLNEGRDGTHVEGDEEEAGLGNRQINFRPEKKGDGIMSVGESMTGGKKKIITTTNLDNKKEKRKDKEEYLWQLEETIYRDDGRESGPTTKIFGGEEAQKGSFPWMTAILDSKKLTVLCGGSIIAPHWVLTAAHCLVYTKERVMVNVGAHSISRRTGKEMYYKVEKSFIHPQYEGLRLQNDIALVKLEPKPSMMISFTHHNVLRPSFVASTTTQPPATTVRRVQIPNTSGAYNSANSASRKPCRNKLFGVHNHLNHYHHHHSSQSHHHFSHTHHSVHHSSHHHNHNGHIHKEGFVYCKERNINGYSMRKYPMDLFDDSAVATLQTLKKQIIKTKHFYDTSADGLGGNHFSLLPECSYIRWKFGLNPFRKNLSKLPADMKQFPVGAKHQAPVNDALDTDCVDNNEGFIHFPKTFPVNSAAVKSESASNLRPPNQNKDQTELAEEHHLEFIRGRNFGQIIRKLGPPFKHMRKHQNQSQSKKTVEQTLAEADDSKKLQYLLQELTTSGEAAGDQQIGQSKEVYLPRRPLDQSKLQTQMKKKEKQTQELADDWSKKLRVSRTGEFQVRGGGGEGATVGGQNDGVCSDRKSALCEMKMAAATASEDNYDSLVGRECLVLGWGTTEAGDESSDTLRYGMVPIRPLKDCQVLFPHINITTNMICAGDPNRKIDTCKGDSGGPLVCKGSTGWHLYGITSFGVVGCGKLGVYTRVDRYRNWIGTTLSKHNGAKGRKKH